MRTISFSDFRQNSSRLLDLVEQGEEIVIQRHGKTIAKLVPAGEGGSPAWKKPGLRLVTKGRALSAAILEDRR